MSYENEISHLRAGLEESKKLYSEAVRKQLHTDVEMWSDDIKSLKYQIIVYAKAEAFDAVLKIFKEEYIESESRNRPYEFITAMRDLIAEHLIAEHESEAE